MDENDFFDESVDPYDKAAELEYDDGIKDAPVDENDVGENEDEAEWDDTWEDDPSSKAAGIDDETSDYEELEE